MDRLISEKAVLEAFREYQGSISDFYKAIKAIPSVDMFSDLKAEISMYENSEQSIDEMIQGIKSIISIYER